MSVIGTVQTEPGRPKKGVWRKLSLEVTQGNGEPKQKNLCCTICSKYDHTKVNCFNGPIMNRNKTAEDEEEKSVDVEVEEIDDDERQLKKGLLKRRQSNYYSVVQWSSSFVRGGSWNRYDSAKL